MVHTRNITLKLLWGRSWIHTLYCTNAHKLAPASTLRPLWAEFTHFTEQTRANLHPHQLQDFTVKASTDTKAFTQRSLYTQTISYTHVHMHRSFYTHPRTHTLSLLHTHTLLNTNALTRRRFYTQKLLHTDMVHTRNITLKLLWGRSWIHTFYCTNAHKLAPASTLRPLWGRSWIQTFYCKRLHRHRSFYTQKLFCTGPFTHIRVYAQTPLHSHTEAFRHRSLYTRTISYTLEKNRIIGVIRRERNPVKA